AGAAPVSPVRGAAEGALTRELKRLVDGSGKPLRALSKEINISASTISRATTGKAFPTLQVALAITGSTDGDPEQVRRLWADADEERRPGSQALTDVDLEGDERQLLRVTAAALNAELKRRHLSLGKLARTAGYGKSTLSTLFRGERVPDALMLNDVLQSMGLTDTEIRNWTARFARAAEKARQADLTRPTVDLAAALAPLESRLRRQTVVLTVLGTFTVVSLGLGGLAIWAANDVYSPTVYEPATRTVTAGTPVPPGPKTARVDVGSEAERVSVFEQARTDAAVKATIESMSRVVLVCQVTTGVPFSDPDLTYPSGRETKTNTWVKISLGDKEIGFVPNIYLLQDSDQRPVLPPPACG
ncbi:MAG: hypothetical protein QOI78_7816, partial [Actinomycetota bacterium]|nr:hypothetical protein [Actinomycetota bacterium]